MFERFTERARRVVILAQEETRKSDHSVVTPEHVLLGLLHEGEGVACKILDGLGVDRDDIRRDLETGLGRGTAGPTEELTFSRPAKRILELALDEAQRFGHSHLGTEHLLIGILRDVDSSAAKLLVSRNITVERVRSDVGMLLGEGTPASAPKGKLPEFRVVPLGDALTAALEVERALNEGYTLTQEFREFVVLQLGHRKPLGSASWKT